MENIVRELRSDFRVAISSEQNEVTLDPSIGSLRNKSQTSFLPERSRFTHEVTCETWTRSAPHNRSSPEAKSIASGVGRRLDLEIVRCA